MLNIEAGTEKNIFKNCFFTHQGWVWLHADAERLVTNKAREAGNCLIKSD